MNLAGIVGHRHAIDSLLRAHATGRLHHAYLFSGPDGVGKRAVARALAAFLLCTNRTAEDACGRCAACAKFRSGNHPDFLSVEPDGRFIKIEQVRDIISATRFRPNEADLRVIVIDQVDDLKEEAANALLKTLEEPRGDTMFLLVSSAPQRVLSTIRSRSIPLRFQALTDAEVARVLQLGGTERGAAEGAARFAAGSVTRAQRALESTVFAARGTLLERLAQLRADQRFRALELAEELARDTENLPELLDLLRVFLRDAALLQSGHGATRIVNEDLRPQIEALAADLAPADSLRLFSEVDRTERLLQGNVNPRMAMESLFLSVSAARQR